MILPESRNLEWIEMPAEEWLLLLEDSERMLQWKTV